MFSLENKSCLITCKIIFSSPKYHQNDFGARGYRAMNGKLRYKLFSLYKEYADHVITVQYIKPFLRKANNFLSVLA